MVNTTSTTNSTKADPRAHHKFWPKRVPYEITPPATSLWRNLEVSALRFPDKDAVIFLGRRYSYAELAQSAERLAAQLCALGLQKGERVILCMQNCPQFIIGLYAIFRANAVVVPVNPMNRATELQHYITDPQSRLAIVSSDLASELAQANQALAPAQRLAGMVVTHVGEGMGAGGDTGVDAGALDITVPTAWQAWLEARPPLPKLDSGPVISWQEALQCQAPLPAHTLGPDDLAALPYTSGTTGLPKGCVHPHSTLMHNVAAGALWTGGNADNVMLAVAPMFHATGFVGMLTGTFLGASLVLMPRWDRDVAGQLISRYRVTQWSNIPTMVMDLLASPNFAQYDLSSLVTIGGGGAAMPQAVAQRLLDQYGLRYLEGYGLTETAAPSHYNPPDAPKQQCLGIPFVGCDSRVIDPQTLQEVAQGEQGEIVIHGPMIFQGYWQRPEATAAAFMELDGKRFFRSGDLGRVDEDGYFFITDRLKRMINAAGFKVWPAEVEALMYQHPAIAEACVIAAQDSYRGETVKAVVVLRQGHQGQVSEQDVINWCREHMAVYKAPRLVQFVPSLPKSGSGKVMWRLLQEAEVAT